MKSWRSLGIGWAQAVGRGPATGVGNFIGCRKRPLAGAYTPVSVVIMVKR